MTRLVNTPTLTVGDSTSYNCTDPVVTTTFPHYTNVLCTLPSSVQQSDLNRELPLSGVFDGVVSDSSGPGSSNFITLVESPMTPTLTAVTCCLGGSGGAAATACRAGEILSVQGSSFSCTDLSWNVLIAGSRSYSCPVSSCSSSQLTCSFPDVAVEDLYSALPVTVVVGPVSSSYTPGVESFGRLSLTSIVGCATVASFNVSGTGCESGDVVNITGTGFGNGATPDLNDIGVSIGDQTCTTLTQVSDSLLQCALPSPPSSLNVDVWVYAGPQGSGGVVTQKLTLIYASAFIQGARVRTE